ncbi:sulfur carrier protein ThiS [Ferrimonas balearica]|uniref:sulfur carrier protein ThiS n=1 Tax=Ferrimonas balearica TaxID=44012 RepID=UPI001C9979CF|nr:sulfur carrier protein ThiS [Ferrimonas balearica]MBY5991744.1 sulfur carrier protein ThiS [Ferrimonas balearica]
MNILLNQQTQSVAANTIAQLLTELGQDKPGVAVALNGTVVRKSAWGDTPIKEGDALDLFSVIAGG